MYSLYLHIPFCAHRCAYCDFNTYAGQESLIPAYADALVEEINYVGRRLRDYETKRLSDHSTIGTIFFGGGTPSLLSPSQFDSILGSLRANFTLTEDAEITIEANPGTVTFANLQNLRSLEINRISFGVQSANTEELRMLERTHSFFDVIEAVTSARKAGFDNLNLDLIYGLPEQSLQTWQTTVKRILDLHPEHISAYALTLEHGTPFGRWAKRGLLPLPNPDLAAEMYEWASETLEANGYEQYEISNWAKNKDENGRMKDEFLQNPSSSFIFDNSSFACRHNLQYWRALPYLAFGAGAHGYAHGYRYSNVLRIKTYIERITNYQLPNSPIRRAEHVEASNLQFPLSPVTVNHHKQTLQDDMSEFMINGLRLTREGISIDEFEQRFGKKLQDVFGKKIDELLKLGLLESKTSEFLKNSEVLRLTPRARLLGNQAFMRFV
ncbi:MAG: radical SAM family heme chaperone HemW [Anaerolineales bacterium]|nr:radical SAM family heme chaperone HemW [Anaerolineales bacterium]